MSLDEACAELNARNCGPYVGISHDIVDDGESVLCYIDFARGFCLTALVPVAIRDLPEHERLDAVKGCGTWQVHELGGDA